MVNGEAEGVCLLNKVARGAEKLAKTVVFKRALRDQGTDQFYSSALVSAIVEVILSDVEREAAAFFAGGVPFEFEQEWDRAMSGYVTVLALNAVIHSDPDSVNLDGLRRLLPRSNDHAIVALELSLLLDEHGSPNHCRLIASAVAET